MLSVCELMPLPSPSPLPSLPLPLLLPSSLLPALAQQPFLLLPPIDPNILVLKYKHVDKKVKPIPVALPKEFCNIRHIPKDPLLMLPLLPTYPPDFMPSNRLMQEHLDKLDLNSDSFLWPEELKLIQHILKLNEGSLAWTEAEKGRFYDEYFSPVKIPVVKHTPWIHKNLPILLGIYNEVVKIFKKKLAAGIYKYSNTSYHSCWFCVEKKNGSYCIVHNL